MTNLWSRIAEVWHWWVSEIMEIVPALERLKSNSLPARLLARIDETGAIAVERSDASNAAGDGVLALQLPDDIVLSKTIAIPRAARRNAEEIAKSKLPWETPFEADNAYYGYHLADDGDTNELALTLIAAPKKMADRLFRELKEKTVNFDGVGAALSLPGQSAIWVELVRPHTADTKTRNDKRLLAAIGLGLAVLLFGPMVSYQLQTSAIEQTIERHMPDAQEAAAARAELRRLTAGQAAIRQSGQFIPRTQIIDDLSALVPLEDWLYRLQINDGEVEIFGFSDDPANLLAALSGAPNYQDARFRSPTLRDETTGKQRFHIGARLVGADE